LAEWQLRAEMMSFGAASNAGVEQIPVLGAAPSRLNQTAAGA
jgi:hypothetical protein